MYEYDANMAYVTIKAAQDLLGTGNQITRYGMRLDDVDHASQATKALQQQLGLAYWVRSWVDFNRPLTNSAKQFEHLLEDTQVRIFGAHDFD